MEKLSTAKSVEYNTSSEYNVESYIYTDGNYFCIQVSSWKSKNKAAQEISKLTAAGHSAFMVEATPPHKKETWYRVRIGYFDNLEGAREYQKRIP